MIDYQNRNVTCIHHAPSSVVTARRRLQTFVLPSLCVLLIGGSSWVAAQQLVDISGCTRLTDDKERFACYDNLARSAGAMPPASQATTAATPPAPASARAAATPAASATAAAAPSAPPVKLSTPPAATSTDSSRIAAFGNASKAHLEKGSSGQEMLVDTVTVVKNYKQDIVQITLSSGQVWRQMIAQRFLLLEGDKIHIVPNPWGNSYRLSVDGRSGFIQVEKLAQK